MDPTQNDSSSSELSLTQAQMLENIRAYAGHLRVDLSEMTLERVAVAYVTFQPLDITSKFPNILGPEDDMSEVIFTGPTERLIESLERNFDGGQPNPHPGYTLNYRQNVLRWSMQVNVLPATDKPGRASFDVDRWNPNYGLLGIFGHIGECIYDSAAACDTDPKAVCQALKKMGIPVKEYL